MNNKAHKLRILIAVGLVFVLVGCASMQRKEEEAQTQPLEVAALLKFIDLPVPTGFQFLPQSSFAFQNEDFRVGLLRYAGISTGSQVVKFYQDQMPMYNWNFVSLVEYNNRVISFERDNESAVVFIETKGKKVNIAISISPKPKSRASSAAQVIK